MPRGQRRPNGRGRARGRATSGRHDKRGHLTKRMILCIHFLSSSNLNCDIY